VDHSARAGFMNNAREPLDVSQFSAFALLFSLLFHFFFTFFED
jgi:hypothetical protein